MIKPSYMCYGLLCLLMYVLTIIALPTQLNFIRPLWVLMWVLYIQVRLPGFFRLSHVIWIGLILDVLSSSILGTHMLALVLTTWGLAGRARRFVFFSMPQQMVWVGLLSLCYQSILGVLCFELGRDVNLWMMLWPIGMTVILWPWMTMLFDRVMFVSKRL